MPYRNILISTIYHAYGICESPSLSHLKPLVRKCHGLTWLDLDSSLAQVKSQCENAHNDHLCLFVDFANCGA